MLTIAQIFEVKVDESEQEVFTLFMLEGQLSKLFPFEIGSFLMIEYCIKSLKEVHKGFFFFNWKFCEFYWFNFSHSLFNSCSNGFHILGLGLDLFWFGSQKSWLKNKLPLSCIGKLFHFIPLVFDFMDILFAFIIFFFEVVDYMGNFPFDFVEILIMKELPSLYFLWNSNSWVENCSLCGNILFARVS